MTNAFFGAPPRHRSGPMDGAALPAIVAGFKGTGGESQGRVGYCKVWFFMVDESAGERPPRPAGMQGVDRQVIKGLVMLWPAGAGNEAGTTQIICAFSIATG